MLVRDVFDTFAALAGLVQGVTGTDYWAQNRCARVRVFSRLLKVDLQQMGREIERKNCCVSILHPISTDGPRHLLLRRGSSLERLFYPLQSKKKFVVVAVRVLSLFFSLVFVQELGVANVIHQDQDADLEPILVVVVFISSSSSSSYSSSILFYFLSYIVFASFSHISARSSFNSFSSCERRRRSRMMLSV